MPVQLTYPGVQIEETPSNSRSISGTSSSITAFIGTALRGPVNEPIHLQNFSDFSRIFGGLWRKSTLGYAIQQYFVNGGKEAIIVRVQKRATNALLRLKCPASEELKLQASNPGSWGNKLRAHVDNDVSEDIVELFGLEKSDLFNLTLYDGNTGNVEEFRNLTIKESPRKVDDLLKNQSKLAWVSGDLPKEVPNNHNPPAPGKTPWGETSSTKVDDADKGEDGDLPTPEEYEGSQNGKTGIYALDKVDDFDLLCIPPIANDIDIPPKVWGIAGAYSRDRRAMLIVDSPKNWVDKDKAIEGLSALNLSNENAAIFFPRLLMPDPLQENRSAEFSPCGAVAGVFARTDAERGVWKSPAGVQATLRGIQGLSLKLTDAEQGQLNILGVNCLRSFPGVGSVIYGSRTSKGSNSLASEFKYISIRRLTLYIEESLSRGTQYAVFEPNDENLWIDLRFTVQSFMQDLFRKGAFQRSSKPEEAYFVKCDEETTTQDDINRGVVNIVVGFAPVKPAEFLILRIQQLAQKVE